MEFILSNDLPEKKDRQKKRIVTKNKVKKSIVKEHVKGQGKSRNEQQYK